MNNDNQLNNNVTPDTNSLPPVVDPTNVTPEANSLPPVVDPTNVTPSSDTNAPQTSTPEPTVSTPNEPVEIVEASEPQPGFENRMVNPGNIGDISIKKDTPDPNGAVNENLKKVEVNYTPPSKGKTVALILFFIFMIAFVFFLPEITELVNKYKAGKKVDEDIKITTGKLVCTYNTNTTNLDKDYELVFGFTNNKLDSLDYSVTTKGDPTEDEDTLNKLSEQCNNLKDFTKNVSGVSVDCEYTEGRLTETQSFTYANIDSEELNSAYSEAGGTNPQYEVGQDMDTIEKNMNASGYTCERQAR